jgi:hypothetical protein
LAAVDASGFGDRPSYKEAAKADARTEPVPESG